MKQELPNLVDERRFRRREPEQVERDEFGRVNPPCRSLRSMFTDGVISGNGLKNGFLLIWSPFQVSICEHKW